MLDLNLITEEFMRVRLVKSVVDITSEDLEGTQFEGRLMEFLSSLSGNRGIYAKDVGVITLGLAFIARRRQYNTRTVSVMFLNGLSPMEVPLSLLVLK